MVCGSHLKSATMIARFESLWLSSILSPLTSSPYTIPPFPLLDAHERLCKHGMQSFHTLPLHIRIYWCTCEALGISYIHLSHNSFVILDTCSDRLLNIGRHIFLTHIHDWYAFSHLLAVISSLAFILTRKLLQSSHIHLF